MGDKPTEYQQKDISTPKGLNHLINKYY